MGQSLEENPRYRQTMARLEAAKRVSSDDKEYWFAREISGILGYASWSKFEPVIDRARSSFQTNDIDPSHQIVQTGKLMGVGKGGSVQGRDYFLSRPACYLIAMNGDPAKPEIAAAQAYFVIETRLRELDEQKSDDEKRLELREKVARSFKTVSGVAKKAGVRNHLQAVFHDARYLGLYGMSSQDVKRRKGIESRDNLFDRAGPLELSANEFQMNLAAHIIQKDDIRGEQRVIDKNKALAADVRRVIKDGGGSMPEDLPLEEPIKEVKKRLRQKQKQLAMDAPNA